MKDASHLVRLMALLVVVLAAFLVVRSQVVPPDFGLYGHYRAGALKDVMAKPVVYAGRETCAICHEDQAKAIVAGRHAGVSCEACHGPQAAHADDPSGHKPKLPEVVLLCPTCHRANSAKPKNFPQVVPDEHSGGVECNTCHQPHQPTIR